ncbi:hypothetical protein WAF17_20415 [Bernardetia sp. ABR2-2B]|uniref:hypothetical protein n=1 Tax=Bernardetia sp. ABR2-2B TaxID=3127472 RepID=UPI0030D55274
MKKIKSIYILFVFAAISSYGLWACTNTGTSETTSTSDSTQTEEVEEPDTRPASAAIDNDFYIKATIEGKEYNFNYLPLDNVARYNLLKNNLFRIERCADDHCKESIYLQAHNFDFNQETPFVLQEGSEGKLKKDIIVNLIRTNNKGKFKNQMQDAEPFEMTIEKIEGDIYQGSFKGMMRDKETGTLLNVMGSFRTKMVIRNPAT